MIGSILVSFPEDSPIDQTGLPACQVRILCDVNILVRANEHASDPARRLLLTLLADGHTLIASAEMLVELARVIRYPRLQELYGLSEEQSTSKRFRNWRPLLDWFNSRALRLHGFHDT